MDCATAAHGKLDACVELSGDDNEMKAKVSIVRTRLCRSQFKAINPCSAIFVFGLPDPARHKVSVFDRTQNSAFESYTTKPVNLLDSERGMVFLYGSQYTEVEGILL